MLYYFMEYFLKGKNNPFANPTIHSQSRVKTLAMDHGQGKMWDHQNMNAISGLPVKVPLSEDETERTRNKDAS